MTNFTYDITDGNVSFEGLDASDTLTMTGGLNDQNFSFLKENDDLLIYTGAGTTVRLTNHFLNDTSRIETINITGSGTIDLAALNTITVTSSDQINILGTSANDLILGGEDNNTFLDIGNIAEGDDIIYAGAGDDLVEAGKGDDILYGGLGNDTLVGGQGDDIVDGQAGNDLLHGGGSDDEVYGGIGDDEIHGGEGNDTLHGGNGNDQVFGDNGDDILYGNDGLDALFGEAGADTFVFEAASAYNHRDNVKDFSLSEGDMLDLSNLLTGYDALTDAITDFVQITDNGVHSYVAVDADGGADNFQQVAQLSSITGITDEALLEANGTLITA